MHSKAATRGTTPVFHSERKPEKSPPYFGKKSSLNHLVLSVQDTIVFQFHKYWNDPDEESISNFVEIGKRLNVPLWMGEGGANNLQWYTYIFPMYEHLKIGWCFWSYKKMETPNSPVTFKQPEEWKQILAYLDGGTAPAPNVARVIFNEFLHCISCGIYHEDVIHALIRKPDIEIPAAAFDIGEIKSSRIPGTQFRIGSCASTAFAEGHRWKADWNRYGGEPQPYRERLLLFLDDAHPSLS